MMWKESAAVVIAFLVLTAIGVGPALWMVKDGSRRLQYALCLSPALGLLLCGLLGFPLVRFVGIPSVWVRPATLVLLAISAGLAFRAWPALRAGWRLAEVPWRFAAPTVLLGLLLGVLILPMLYNGIHHAVFRGNPGDAFLYISQAQAIQEAPLQVQMEGAELENNPGVAALAHRSPVALFSARTLLLPLSLNRPAAHAWLAELTGLQSWRFYYGFHLVVFAAAAFAALGLAVLLGVSRPLAYAAAAATGIGFWARWVLESDAGYQIAAFPILLLLVFAWIETELEEPSLRSRSRLLLALALAGVITFYGAFLPPLLIAAAAYYGLALIQRAKPGRRILLHGASILAALAIIAATGQLDWIEKNARSILIGLKALPTEGEITSGGLTILMSDGLAALWGLPARLLFGSLPARWLLPLEAGFQVLAMTLTLAFFGAAVVALRQPREAGTRIVFCLAAAGLLTLAGLVYVDGTPNNVNNYAAGKAYTFVYPFPILLALAYPRFAKSSFSGFQARAIAAGLAVWGALQVALGFYIPFHTDRRPPFSDVFAEKTNAYDLRSLTRVLDKRGVRGLLVFTPREGHFTFPYYLMYVLAPYQPHYQSGLVIDNNALTPNLWVDKLREVPEYALVTRKADYIGARGLGEKLAETPDLILYRLTQRDPATYRAVEAHQEQRDKLNPGQRTLIGTPDDPTVILIKPKSGSRSP